MFQVNTNYKWEKKYNETNKESNISTSQIKFKTESFNWGKWVHFIFQNDKTSLKIAQSWIKQ